MLLLIYTKLWTLPILELYFDDPRFTKNLEWYNFLGFECVDETFDFISMSKKFNYSVCS